MIRPKYSRRLLHSALLPSLPPPLLLPSVPLRHTLHLLLLLIFQPAFLNGSSRPTFADAAPYPLNLRQCTPPITSAEGHGTNGIWAGGWVCLKPPHLVQHQVGVSTRMVLPDVYVLPVVALGIALVPLVVAGCIADMPSAAVVPAWGHTEASRRCDQCWLVAMTLASDQHLPRCYLGRRHQPRLNCRREVLAH